MTLQKSITYQQAGVHRELARPWVETIKQFGQSTRTANVMAHIGGFAGLYALPQIDSEPILVSATDGVGTKIQLACELDAHEVVGQDVVAMCVNDVLTYGAQPLFFLDYIATSALDISTHSRVMTGIAVGCKQANCALLGGETAQMPGIYTNKFYDLAGFSVGLVSRSILVDGSQCKPGNTLIGLSSSGVHSNGFSLIRTILQRDSIDMKKYIPELSGTLAEHLMVPTKIYVSSVLTLLKSEYAKYIYGMAHITGGGLVENIARILPPTLSIHIDPSSFVRPPIFDWLAKVGPIDNEEMQKTFNLGIGFVLVVDHFVATQCVELLQTLDQDAYPIGSLR